MMFREQPHKISIIRSLPGTFDTASESEEKFEVINIGKIRAHTPNLRIVNFYGVTFVDDTHIEMLAASCIHLEVLAVNYCLQVTGSSLKLLMSRCKKLQTLLLRHTGMYSRSKFSQEFKSAI